jgi:hypothetical protein
LSPKTADIASVPVLLEKQALNTVEKQPIDGSEDVYPDGGLQVSHQSFEAMTGY